MRATQGVGIVALPRLDALVGAEAIRTTLLSRGAAIVERAAAAALMLRLETLFHPWFAAAPCGEEFFLGRRTRRFSGVFAKVRECAALATNPLVLEIVEPLLKGEGASRADAIQLHLTQAIAIEPGERGQVLHRDDTAFPFAHDFELMVNVMWPLDRFTALNGATCIVPDSHLWARDLRPEESAACAAEAMPGDAIFWLGSTLHGGGANRSANARRGIVMSYSLAWLAQAEKLLLSTPPEVARVLPEKLQRLIGFQVHRPNLGWVEERDPLEWLQGRVGALAPARDHFPPELKLRLEMALEGQDDHTR